MKVFTIELGARVHSRALGQDGVVIRLYGDLATVRFPSGDRTVPVDSLESQLADPLELIAAGEFGNQLEWFDIKLRATKLQAAYGSDNLSGLVNSRVVLRPHQIFLAHRILEKPRPSMILADEVGLGKTIEAGLVLKELLARKSIARILIIVPPNLLNQWATELRIKFNEIFEIVDTGSLRSTRQLYPNRNPWLRFPRALISSYLARAEDTRDELVDADWDLVIVDEAHHCRRKLEGNSVEPTLLYRTVDALKDSTFGVMLLTATPMQLHHFELFSLVELVEPGLYESYEEFEKEILASLELRTAVRALENWPNVSSEERAKATSLLQRHGIAVDMHSPIRREDAIDQLLSQIRLTQSIVRNRKRTVGGFTQRRALRIAVQLTDLERQVHESLERYLWHGFDAARAKGDRLFGFELVTFQRLLASSSRALRRALERRKERLWDEHAQSGQMTDDPDERLEGSRTLALSTLREETQAIDDLISRLDQVRDSKAVALVSLVQQLLDLSSQEKILIFTQYYATQDLLVELLSGRYRVVQFRGDMSRWEKDEVVRRFQESAQIMVSTEAGGEGRNFQFCHVMVNYDLHWNPMRIEQRIGRLDRYGQKKDVHIYNITARGTIEDRLVDVLERRLNLFEATVGALELILGEVEDDLRNALVEASGNVEEAVHIFERDLDLRLRDAKLVEEKSADFLIEISSFRREVAERLTSELEEGRVRIDLERLVLHILSLFPTARVEPDGEEAWKIEVPPALPNAVGRRLERSYHGTFSAALAVTDETLDFFGFGHPLVDTCLAYASRESFGGLAGVRSLPTNVLRDPALQLNFLVEFSGVRKRSYVESMVLRLDGSRDAEAERNLPLAEPITATGGSPSLEVLEELRGVAIERIREFIERERPAVAEVNRQRAADEAARAARIHRYNSRRLSEKERGIRGNLERIETEGDPDQRRILPALRGQIDAIRRDQTALDADLQRQLAELDKLKAVSESFQLINAALLLPA